MIHANHPVGPSMSYSLNSEVTSRGIGIVQGSVASNFRKLASGKSINAAADNAAGLAIAEQLEAELRADRQASRNGNDGISMIQVAEGATAEVTNMLGRMRELTVAASSDTLSQDQRDSLSKEYTQLRQEIDRISETTKFNGRSLFQDQDLAVQVGANGSSENRVDLSFQALSADSLGVDNIDFSSADSARAGLSSIETALNNTNGMRAGFGAAQNRFESAIRNLATSDENNSAALSRIQDADFAEVTANLTRDQILLQASTSVFAQSNANRDVAWRLLQQR